VTTIPLAEEADELISALELCALTGAGTTLTPRQAVLLLEALCAFVDDTARPMKNRNSAAPLVDAASSLFSLRIGYLR
jgi:hypothetical protein